jgi:orotate phosphoribosyltransferase
MDPIPFPGPRRSNNADAVTLRQRAFNLIKERSFGRKKIRLASGRESDFYFDMKPTLMHPEGAYCLAELVLKRLQNEPVDFIGGVAVGAVPLISAVTVLSYTHHRPLPGFFVRKEVKDHGTKKLIDGVDTLEGCNVAILEDVTTTGGSSMIAVDAARKSGGAIALVLSIVDREEGAVDFYRQAGIPFDSIFKASEFLAAS